MCTLFWRELLRQRWQCRSYWQIAGRAVPVLFDRLGRMRLRKSRNGCINGVLAVAFMAGGLSITGCGTPGAPQAPSLKLPEPVSDLTAERAGSEVELHWTMPRKNTDHLVIEGSIQAAICRRDGVADCKPAGTVAFAPGAQADFHETLPADLQSGIPRQLIYFVELKSPKGRSAGLSSAAVVLAGAAPAAVAGLRAEVRADGVALHWNRSEPSKTASVRLHRKLLTPPAPKEKRSDSGSNSGTSSGRVSTPAEPVLRDLLVEAPAAEEKSGALDSSARFGEVYEYTAQRVEQLTVDGKALELAGENSAPIRVDVVDTFPPAVPSGLVAVVVAEEKSIDLSWQPDTDEDLAGYIVYRAMGGDAGNSTADWVRISGPQPVAGPAYRDTTVTPEHSYRYAVSAIDLTGHESIRSSEADEAVPEASPNQ